MDPVSNPYNNTAFVSLSSWWITSPIISIFDLYFFKLLDGFDEHIFWIISVGKSVAITDIVSVLKYSIIGFTALFMSWVNFLFGGILLLVLSPTFPTQIWILHDNNDEESLFDKSEFDDCDNNCCNTSDNSVICTYSSFWVVVLFKNTFPWFNCAFLIINNHLIEFSWQKYNNSSSFTFSLAVNLQLTIWN